MPSKFGKELSIQDELIVRDKIVLKYSEHHAPVLKSVCPADDCPSVLESVLKANNKY